MRSLLVGVLFLTLTGSVVGEELVRHVETIEIGWESIA
ncbi:Uncharacterised protein [Mycobacteroides abscessus subsp. abscessus]|nr:Uncharacterised protein [Mycobacteroides abscessus subsp. abscessus]